MSDNLLKISKSRLYLQIETQVTNLQSPKITFCNFGSPPALSPFCKGGLRPIVNLFIISFLGKVSIKKTLKVMEFSIKILPLPAPPPFYEKKKKISTIFLYVFIMFIITKFGENFEDKIQICFFLNVLNKKVEVKKCD